MMGMFFLKTLWIEIDKLVLHGVWVKKGAFFIARDLKTHFHRV